MRKELSSQWQDLGEFIRGQREITQLSLRRLAELADVSNPYLSQIERGLRRPSAEILQQIAKALQISAESLYVRAGILDADTIADTSVREAILRDREHCSQLMRSNIDAHGASLYPYSILTPRPATGQERPLNRQGTASRIGVARRVEATFETTGKHQDLG